MSISSINYGSSVLGAQIRNINQQLTDLSTQLSTGKLSQNYSGMGTNEGFAIASRAQLSNIAAYTDTITNVNVNINLANTALQSLTTIRNTVQTGSAGTSQDLNVNGQTIAQNTAAAQFGSMVGVLNTQSGNRYLFSGTAYNTQSVADAGDIINGTTTQAGLKTVMAERQAADLGTNGMGRLVQSTLPSGAIQVQEDSPTSPFGLKIAAVSSTLTGATVTGPSGSPVAFSVNLNGVNPNNGDKLSVQFTLPDGSTEQINLTASTATPTPVGSFAIDPGNPNIIPPVPSNPAITSANLNTALNTAITKLANTSLVAASAVAAGDNFFNRVGSATANVAATGNLISAYTSTTGTGSVALQDSALAPASATTSLDPSATPHLNGTTLNALANAPTGTTLTITGASGAHTITFNPTVTTVTTASGNTTIGLASGSAAKVSDILNAIATAAGVPSANVTLSASGNIQIATGTGTDVTVTAGAAATALGLSSVTRGGNVSSTPPITGSTVLSGTATTGGPEVLSTAFQAGSAGPPAVSPDTITVNGQTLTFVASGATGPNQINITDNVTTLLGKIDQITGTTKPSTIHGGVITINTDDPGSLNITSSNSTAFAALGFTTSPVTAAKAPLRVGSSPLGSATTLVNGSANTVKWYTGNDGPGSARSTAVARVDDSVTVQYGAQADENAIRSQLQAIAVFGTFSTSPTGQYSGAQVAALSLRTTQALTPQAGQQKIEDIQTDIAMAQNTMKDASTRQTQAKAQLQTIVDQAESASPDQVASEILSLQNALQASYQTTANLAQLSLVKYL
ncbi:flagellar hook associated protein [Bradyrhizobium sp. CCBAU 11434]|uniref:Flagellar hook associated protein n=1 Tax=Bradyrhizobium zhengyangense TaxID=2911009 RepID=A0ABS9LXP0_9BRAD|nr:MULTISPECIES: flagellar hook associated protein [Bradyrhizobium]MCG2671769.1 flagellar hook associated protein [Bradyrhizobium zhengyangense]MDA9519399.1 flagellar hook associated protein [Bradyrhizobium sp. CCBAU 11434]